MIGPNDIADRPLSNSRALVPVSDDPDRHTSPQAGSPRPAAFLAHLIATDRHLPQTCERRRAQPCEVIAAYREAMARFSVK